MSDPSIPNVPTSVSDPQLRLMLEKMKEMVEQRAGQRGEELDASPTWRELYNRGLVRYRRNGVIYEKDPNGDFLPGNGSGSGSGTDDAYDPNEDLSIPPAPTGVMLSTTVNKVLLTWNAHGTRYVRMMEIWRSDDNDVNNAVLVGVSSYQIYADVGTPLEQYTYWLRFVSYRGTPGPWHNIAGSTITLPNDPSAYLGLLNGQITESELYAGLNTRIDLIDTPTTGLVDALAQEAVDRAAADTAEATARASAISAEASARAADILAVTNGYQGADTAIQTQLDSVEVTANNASTGVATNANAITGIDTRVTSAESSITTQAGQLTALETDMTAAEGGISANTTAIGLINTTITTHGTDITANSSDITQLQTDLAITDADLDAAETNITANANAISSLDTRVTSSEGNITVQSNRLDALEVALGNNIVVYFQATAPTTGEEGDYWVESDNANAVTKYTSGSWVADAGPTVFEQAAEPGTHVDNDIWIDSDDSNAAYISKGGLWIPADGSQISAQSAAINDLTARVTANEGTLTSQGSSITALQSDVSDNTSDIAAATTARNALDTRVTQNENDITVNVNDISALDTRLTTNEGNTSANASAISSLSSNLSVTDGVVATAVADITALEANMSAAELDIAGNLSAINAVEGRMTTAENGITVNTSDINALDTRLTANEGNTTANASGISTLTTNLALTDANVDAAVQDITALEANYAALDTTVGGHIVDIAANALAISNTQTIVTQQGDDITALSATVDQHSASLELSQPQQFLNTDLHFQDTSNNWVVVQQGYPTAGEILAGQIDGNPPFVTDASDVITGGKSIALGVNQTNPVLKSKVLLPTEPGEKLRFKIGFKLTVLPTAEYAEMRIGYHVYSATGGHIQTKTSNTRVVLNSDLQYAQSVETVYESTQYGVAAHLIPYCYFYEPGTNKTTHGVIQYFSVEKHGIYSELDRVDVALQKETITRADETGDLFAQYAIKVDAGGYVAGYGLAVQGNVYDDTIHSSMLFNVDTFAIGSPGANSLSFIVDNGNVLMDAAFITNLTVNDAQIQDLSVDKLIGDTASFISANLGDASITNAKIGSVIESDNYVPDLSGWHLNKNGDFFCESGVFRGSIESASMTGGTITGSFIRGSVIAADSELTYATEGNAPGQYDFLCYARDLTDTKTIDHSGYFFAGDILTSPATSLYSANHSNTNVYHRYHKLNVTPTVIVAETTYHTSRYRWSSREHSFRVRIRQGSSTLATATVLHEDYGINATYTYPWGTFTNLLTPHPDWDNHSASTMTFSFDPIRYVGDSRYYADFTVLEGSRQHASFTLTLTDVAENIP